MGDDILHAPLPFYSSPAFIALDPPQVSDEKKVDSLFVDFIGHQLLGVINALQSSKNYTAAYILSYSPYLVNQVLTGFWVCIVDSSSPAYHESCRVPALPD